MCARRSHTALDAEEERAFLVLRSLLLFGAVFHREPSLFFYDISKKAHKRPGEGPTPCAHFYVFGWGFQVAPSLASDARRGAAS